MGRRSFAVVRELLGDGDRTEANPGTYANVLLDSGPPLERCGEYDVIISVRAATLNYPDLLQTVGGYQHKPPLPYTPGSECAGVVAKVGSKVAHVRVGDRVAASGFGMMATEVRVRGKDCWRLPSNYSFAEGAAFMMGYTTAYHCLFERAGLKAGEWVLIHGATGGMGLAAVQLARVAGARIIATGGSDEKLRTVAGFGAEAVINYQTTPRFREAVKRLTGGAGVEVVFDPVGGEVFEESLRCARYGCRICVLGFTSGKRAAVRTNYILIKGISLLGCRAGEAVRQGQADGAARNRQLLQWAEEGRIAPHISHVFPLEQVRDAFVAMHRRQILGRAVIAPHGAAGARSKL